MNPLTPEPELQISEPQATPMAAQAQHPQASQNRLARERALQQVSPALNLAAPGIAFTSKGRLLILGAEHRVRLAASKLASLTSITALITEAMPEQLNDEMESAAALVPDLDLYRLPLRSLSGYLGQFDVQVMVDAQPQSLAKLACRVDAFDLVLDLGTEPQLAMTLKPAGYFAPADAASLDAALVEIPGLQGGFEKPRYIQVFNDLCAHSGSGMTGCTRCLDVCPADAISVAAAKVQIDLHLCHGAGGCASACPTAAIRYGFPQPGLLLDSLQRLFTSYRVAGGLMPQLLLHDAASAEQQLPALLEALPGHYLPLQIEELGSAGMEIWLAAIALGGAGVWMLADEQLPESVRGVLESEIDTTNRLLQGLQLQSRVMLTDQDALLQQAHSADAQRQSPLLPIGVLPIQQLDLHANKRQQISSLMSYLFKQQLSRAELPAEALPVEIPLSKGAAFGQVAIDASACTLCMSCVSICPTQALSSAPDTPRLSFSEDACVQCGLCTQACPESVLTLEPRFVLEPDLRTTPRVLHEEPPFCCVSCGVPFATQSVVTLMRTKLAGHSMFNQQTLRRLEMCGDCRVADIVNTDPGSDLFTFAKGRPAAEGEINLSQSEPTPVTKASNNAAEVNS